MEGLDIYSIVDLQNSPKGLICRDDNLSFFSHFPLPLPKQVVVFALGKWSAYKPGATLNVEVHLGDTVKPKLIGSLSEQNTCLCWQDSWKPRHVKAGKVLEEEGRMAKLVITVKGHVKEAERSISPGPPLLLPEITNCLDTTEEEEEEESVESRIGKNEVTPQIEESENQPPSQPEKKRRARMSADKTPSGPTPTKRKPATRVRTLKEMFQPAPPKLEKESPVKEAPPSAKKSKRNDALKSKPDEFVLTGDVEEISTEGPSSRWGHAICMMHDANALMIGGQKDKGQLCKDSIWALNTENKKWNSPDTIQEDGQKPNQKPEMRMGHTVTYDPTVRCVYIYGGSKSVRWYNDVHCLDLDEWKWQLVKTNGKAPTRAYHSATLYRHELWVFGGVYPRPNPQPDGCTNAINIFSPMEESWYEPIVTGEKPLARSGHSATMLKDQLVVFGGWDAPICYNDLNILDMTIVEWTQPKVNGTPPSPRSWHASSSLSGNRVLIHGGYNGNDALDDMFVFSLDALSWTSIKMAAPISARCGHAALCLPYKYDNKDKDEVLIYGGGDNEETFFQDLQLMKIPFEENVMDTSC